MAKMKNKNAVNKKKNVYRRTQNKKQIDKNESNEFNSYYSSRQYSTFNYDMDIFDLYDPEVTLWWQCLHLTE